MEGKTIRFSCLLRLSPLAIVLRRTTAVCNWQRIVASERRHLLEDNGPQTPSGSAPSGSALKQLVVQPLVVQPSNT
jgi:hypothetical protein